MKWNIWYSEADTKWLVLKNDGSSSNSFNFFKTALSFINEDIEIYNLNFDPMNKNKKIEIIIGEVPEGW